MWAFGALLVAAWLGGPQVAAAQAALSLDAPSGLSCPPTAAARAALVRQLAPQRVVADARPRGRFHLTLRPRGTRGVAMTLRAGGAVLVDRALEVAPHDCDGLADTIALITAAWMRDADALPAPVADAPQEELAPSAPAVIVAPAATADAPRGAADRDADDDAKPARPRRKAPATAATEPPEPPLSEAPDEATEAPPSEPRAAAEAPADEADIDAPAATDPPAPTAPTAPDAPPARYGLRLEGALGTTVSLDGLAVPTVTGRAGLEAARNRLRLGLRGHAESARSLAQGAVSVRHAQLELAAGTAFAEGGLLHGAVLLGAGFDLIAAEAPRHQRGGTQRSLAPIGTLALRAGLRARAALDVFASAELVVSLRRERFTADGAPLAQTARSRARLLLGVSWHVF